MLNTEDRVNDIKKMTRLRKGLKEEKSLVYQNQQN